MPAYFVTWNTTNHRNLWTMVNDLIIENLWENEESKQMGHSEVM